jgi:hypothetical protein
VHATYTLRSLTGNLAVVASAGLLFGVAACSSSTTSSPAAPDASVAEGGAEASIPDAASDSPVTTGKGLTITMATVATLDGTYDIPVARADFMGGYGYNGNLDNKIEIEVDTDLAGVVKSAHVWNYTGGPMNAMPDKFYGCDGGKSLACSTVTVDVAKNLITIGTTTWPEVQALKFDASADVLVPGGAKGHRLWDHPGHGAVARPGWSPHRLTGTGDRSSCG